MLWFKISSLYPSHFLYYVRVTPGKCIHSLCYNEYKKIISSSYQLFPNISINNNVHKKCIIDDFNIDLEQCE